MDVLGSILSSMEKPPSKTTKQREMMKKQKEMMMARQKEEKDNLKKFKNDVEERLNKFLNDPGRTRLTFPAMDQMFRGIIREMGEDAGLAGHSFGEEGIDRHLVLFKKEYPPTEDELEALRLGLAWNPQTQAQLQSKREADEKAKAEAELAERLRIKDTTKEEFKPNSNYREKYERLIGKESAVQAAKPTTTNKQYGFVPSENKKDVRSIEQTLNDIKNKKRKLNNGGSSQVHNASGSSSSS